jgi:hypothetical protein
MDNVQNCDTYNVGDSQFKSRHDTCYTIWGLFVVFLRSSRTVLGYVNLITLRLLSSSDFKCLLVHYSSIIIYIELHYIIYKLLKAQ